MLPFEFVQPATLGVRQRLRHARLADHQAEYEQCISEYTQRGPTAEPVTSAVTPINIAVRIAVVIRFSCG